MVPASRIGRSAWRRIANELVPQHRRPMGYMPVVPDAPTRPASWVHFEGQKFRGPEMQRSEAGLTMPLGANVALQVRYERTALAPMMAQDHDDGILTRLRFAF